MPINSFNVGRDVSVTFTGPTGAPVNFAIVTHFEARPMTKKQESHGIDGTVRFQYIPGGWEGQIEFDRANRAFDDLIATFEALYYSGQNVPAVNITETITEADSSVSQWRFDGVMFAMPEHGSWRGDSKVVQRLEFCASFRRRVL